MMDIRLLCFIDNTQDPRELELPGDQYIIDPVQLLLKFVVPTNGYDIILTHEDKVLTI